MGFGIEFFAVGSEDCFQRFRIQLSLGKKQARGPFKGASGGRVIMDPDLFDESVQTDPHGRVADPVNRRQFFERTGGEEKTANESPVFFIQAVQPIVLIVV